MRLLTKWVLVCILLVGPLNADQRFIVRVLGGVLPLDGACLLLGCNVVRNLDDPAGELFLLTTSNGVIPSLFEPLLSALVSIVDIEPDLLVTVVQNDPPIPAALYDSQLVPYFGAYVRDGYISQPAAQIVRIQQAQTTFGVTGTGIVAVIDTGVDPNHPVLNSVLVEGYDFTRNQDGGSEMADVSQSTVAVVDNESPAYVNGYAAAILDQSTVAVVDNDKYSAFGHGTMVAGIVHLVAPQAMIMPLKAFGADGSGYTSDILRAIYKASQAGARVINMSFSMSNSSKELQKAVDKATNDGVICVASVGNQGQPVLVYPAAFSNVMGVASTTNDDTRSTFTNYGQPPVWVAAPGEGIVTTYPWSTYAAAWGTSFSAPFVSGTAALLLQVQWNMRFSNAAAAIANAKPIDSDLGHGRLDIFLAVQAARAMQ